MAKSKLVNVERKIQESLSLDIPTPEPEQYIPQFAARLDLEREDMALAARICRFIDTGELSSDPKLAAAAVLYGVAKKKTTRENVLEKLPIGYAPQLSTMADKIVDLICDQVYNPDAEVESSASPGTFERRFDRIVAKFNDEKIGEAKDILYELLEKQGISTDEFLTESIPEFAVDDLLPEKNREKSKNRMYC